MITLTPVAYVRNCRKAVIDDDWSSVTSRIELADDIPTEAFDGIEAFSHLEVIFHFDRVTADAMVYAAHPRGNTEYPRVGIFAQRKKDRPNALGLTSVELIRREGRTLTVAKLDAIDGTPVLDIKPVFREFQCQGPVMQPDWVSLLMQRYWS